MARSLFVYLQKLVVRWISHMRSRNGEKAYSCISVCLWKSLDIPLCKMGWVIRVKQYPKLSWWKINSFFAGYGWQGVSSPTIPHRIWGRWCCQAFIYSTAHTFRITLYLRWCSRSSEENDKCREKACQTDESWQELWRLAETHQRDWIKAFASGNYRTLFCCIGCSSSFVKKDLLILLKY